MASNLFKIEKLTRYIGACIVGLDLKEQLNQETSGRYIKLG